MYNLPRKYLSSSACDLWEQNKDLFREKYYEGKDGFRTAYTDFGVSFAKQIEENPERFPNIPKYAVPEFPIKWVVCGVPVLGYVDSFCPEQKAVIEYKTSISTGKSPWTAVKVRKWKQLPFYAMCIRGMFGTVHPVFKLIVLSTEWRNEITEYPFRDKVYTRSTRSLEFVPESLSAPRVFEREIRPWEIDLMEERLVTIAKEVTEDFTSYQQLTVDKK
jgi:hypothetical protein